MSAHDQPARDPVHALLERMPKAELHLHLDGSLRPQTALDLARERGLDEGMDLDAMRRRLQAPPQVADQAELLAAFDLPIALMQDAPAIERITHDLVEDVASDGTHYAEIRWGPALHVKGGLDVRGSIAAVVAGAKSGTAATGITVRLIAVALRTHPPQLNLAVALESATFVEDGLTGFDLAGPEEAFPDPLLHADAFEAARTGGLGITIHAGEWGGAAQVRRALAVNPSRIAHGAPAADDDELVEELKSRGVTLDLCPTSNVQASIYPTLADFPLARLLRAGAPVTLSTDDRTVSDLTLVREYKRAMDVHGLSLGELWRMNMHALRVAFLHHDEALRTRLIEEFETFAANEPVPRGRCLTQMGFDKSAEFYDALYSWKDYAAEAETLDQTIKARAPQARTLLDVACGTGHHLELLRPKYSVEGVDIEPSLLEVARERLPGVPLHLGDMRSFNLGRQFDVVTCLFSSIGYMQTPEDLLHALVNMGGHLSPGGVLIVEPWLSPDRFDPNHLPRPLIAEGPDFMVVRTNDSRIEGRLSIMRFHYLVGRPGTVTHFVETHAPALYTPDEYRAAFEGAGLRAELDPEGLMGRGLWVAQRRSLDTR